MLTETGRVVAIEDDGLWVQTLKQSVCSKCSARHGCGQKLLAEISPASNMTFIKALFDDASKTETWAVGDQALLGIDKNALVIAALIAYGVPLVLLVLGMLMGSMFGLHGSDEINAALGALLGLAVGAFLVKQHAMRWGHARFFQPQVIGRKLITINS